MYRHVMQMTENPLPLPPAGSHRTRNIPRDEPGFLPKLVIQLHPVRRLPIWARYSITTLIVFFCFSLRYFLEGIYPYPFLLFLPSVILSAFVFDRGSGFFASLLSGFLAFYFFVEPHYSFESRDIGQIIAVLVFVFVGLLTAAIIEALRSTVDQLEERNEALKAAQEDLARANRELAGMVLEKSEKITLAEARLLQAQKMEDIGRAVTSMAHDFNNILNPILGSTELLKTYHADHDVEALDLLRLIEQVCHSGKMMITDTLDFAQTGKATLQEVNVTEVIRQNEEALRRTVNDRVKIDFRLHDDLPIVLSDPLLLKRALLNLVANARDAMPHGGIITIETGPVTLTGTEGEGAEDAGPGDYVCLTIRDTGSGMSPEILSRVLEPFFTTKPAGQGTGLGLSMVANFVRQAKGRIDIESRLMEGTAVHLYLPRVENKG